jgi:hypothetical protein
VGRTPSLCLAQVLVPGEEEEEGAGWLADMWWWCGRRCTAVSCTLCDISCCVPDSARAFSATYTKGMNFASVTVLFERYTASEPT